MKKRILSAVLALAMIFTALVPVLANAAPADPDGEGFTDVVITKIGLDDLEGWPKGGPDDLKYDGTAIGDLDDYFGTHKLLEGVAFRVYRGSTEADATVANEVNGGPFLTDENGKVTIPSLPNGTYYFVEDKEASTYVGEDGEVLADAAAVPFTLTLPMIKADGTYFGTGEDALYVYPKNTDEKPDIQKGFEGWTADENGEPIEMERTSYDIGDNVPYEVRTTVPVEAKYATFVWQDIMTEGLTYNKDLTFTTSWLVPEGGDAPTDPAPTLESADYRFVYQNDGGFRVELTETGLAKINNNTTPLQITLKYTALINENAEVDVAEENDIQLIYGNQPSESNTPVPVKPVNGSITLNKIWKDTSVEVIFDLYNNHGERVATYTLPVGTTSYTFTDLPAADDRGDLTYYVVERVVSGFYPVYGGETGSLTVTNKETNNPKIDPEEPVVKVGGKKFVKTGDNRDRLAGAEFIVINKNAGDDINKFLARKTVTRMTAEQIAYDEKKAYYDTAIAAYNTWLATEEGKAATKEQRQAKYNTDVKPAFDDMTAAYNAAQMQWTWTATEADAFKFISDSNGFFEVTGLAYGSYELQETKAPEGYAKLTSPIGFTINESSYTTGNIASLPTGSSSASDATEIKNNKVTIPQTGGIGTIIFIIAGLAIMGTAVVVMKKRQELDV